MATGAIAGYKGVIAMSSSAGGSVTAIAEVKNFNVHVAMTEIDATSHDSSGSREVIAGTDAWDGTAELLYVVTNATHKNVFDTLVGKNKVEFEFYPTGSSSDGFHSGSGFVNDWDIGSPLEDALAQNLSFIGTGVLTRSSSA